MSHSSSAQKRVRQNVKQRARNRWRIKTMREAIKDFEASLASGKAEDAQAAFLKVQKIIDRTAQHGVIHRNQAARRKSRLNSKLVKMGSAPAVPATKARSSARPAAGRSSAKKS
ncbi:MAG: 30S ribosomal protein S20 [Phycisphaeraceae bacterium]|nr:30S ribosomal protein S20 [Phycisphaerae bacterium]MBX3393561.1 30S ribosomal protein S20 [Phycisphaeraceae bacterium]